MKFYYNGKLIRTSANHEYTHACIREKADGSFVVLGCRTSRDAAEAIKRSKISQNRQAVANYEAALAAIDSGAKYFINKAGGKEYRKEVGGMYTRKNLEKWISECAESMKEHRALKIVELERK